MNKICPACKNEYEGGEVFCPNDGARLVTASQWEAPAPGEREDPLVGTILNERYAINRLIGEGGMGLVYEAMHVAIEKRVALKVLRDDFSGRPEVVERFKQEAKSASRIGNDHIVDISDFGETPRGAAYFVMELLEGEDLANVLQREATLPVARAADIILQCCTALSAAHRKGIVHRDMKPENIFLTERDARPDFVKIVDFGIAKMSDIETEGAPGRKLTKTGMIFGTPEYMSPEQAAGKDLDHRVDVYALAVILFEMVTGRVPFVGDTFMGILTQHMFEDPPALADVNPNIECPDAIAGFIYRGLSKDPEQRYADCDEMAAALNAALAGRAVGSATYVGYGDPVPSAPGRPRVLAPSLDADVPPPPRSRAPMVAGAIALLAVAGLGAAGWYFALGPGADPATPTAGHQPAADPDAGLAIAEPPPSPPDSGAPAPLEDAGPRLVTLRVNTNPSGARVYVVGRGEVCSASPCEFQLPASNEPITVRATAGRASGELQVIAADDMSLGPMNLSRGAQAGGGSRRRSSGGGGDTQTGGGARRRGGTNDLKFPEMFEDP